MSDEQIKERPYLQVMVELTDLWALQKTIKYNMFVFDPRNGKPMFPSTLTSYPKGNTNVHTAWKLRTKVNSLILRFAQEELKGRLPMPLDYDEAWFIDYVLSEGSYGKARLMLLQVFAVIWEHEMGIPIKTYTINTSMEGADGAASPNALIEYVHQLNEHEQEGWTLPSPDEETPEEVGV